MIKKLLAISLISLASHAMADTATSSSLNPGNPYMQHLEYNRAVNYAASAEDRRNEFRLQADGLSNDFVRRAVAFDDGSNHSYQCSIFANLLYKTAFGNKGEDSKENIFNATEEKGESAGCGHAAIGKVQYGG